MRTERKADDSQMFFAEGTLTGQRDILTEKYMIIYLENIMEEETV